MDKSVNRSAGSGRFVTAKHAEASPKTTTTERVGSGTGNSKTVNRSAGSGRFVTAQTAKRNPGGTVTQKV